MAKKPLPFTAAFSNEMDAMDPAGKAPKKSFPKKKNAKGGKAGVPMKKGGKC